MCMVLEIEPRALHILAEYAYDCHLDTDALI